MSENISKIQALIKLLADPSPDIYPEAQTALNQLGQEALPFLMEALELEQDEDVIQRLKNSLYAIQTENLYRELKVWEASEEQDLLDLMYLIGRIANPLLTKREIVEPIVKIKIDIWQELNDDMTILEQVKVINYILFERHKLVPDEQNPFDVSNFFIDKVLDFKKGNDITLGVLYLYFAQSQKIPFWGVNLHPNFLLAYTGNLDKNSTNNIHFYLNPYKKGIMFSVPSLLEYITKTGSNVSNKEMQPCSNADIAMRWLEFLRHAYIRSGDDWRLDIVNALLYVFY